MSGQRSAIESVFDARVDAWVSTALTGKTSTFSELLRALPGVYPTAVLGAVERLAQAAIIEREHARNLANEAAVGENLAPCRHSLLPLPHPIDYEWRFTPRAGRELLDLAGTLSQAGDEVVLFGTPSVALEAMSHPIERALSFLGPDNAVTRRLLAINEAVGSPIAIRLCTDIAVAETAQVVVLDPPWYLDFVRPMLAAAANVCRQDGYLLASLHPKGARARAELDRTRLFRLAAKFGLEVVSEQPLCVEYDTPFFEANALTAAKIGPMRAWRRGDLVVLRKVERRPIHTSSNFPRASRWREVQIGQMRLFISQPKQSSTRGRGLIHLIDGDILPTVSRRDARRRRAAVWSSGNRIFGSDDPEIAIAAALQAAQTETRPGAQPLLCGTIAERDEIERVACLLRDLAVLEANEERAMRSPSDGKRGIPWTSAQINFSNESIVTPFG